MYNKTLFCPTSLCPVSVPVVWFYVSSVVSRPHVVYLTPKAKCVLLSKRGVVASLRPCIYIYIYVGLNCDLIYENIYRAFHNVLWDYKNLL